MSKRKIALIINIIIVISEIIGLIIGVKANHSLLIEYYTTDSNLMTLLGSILFIIFYKKEKDIVKDIRFISTSCLTVTFLVVAFILCPMYNFNYKLLMFTDYFFIFHTLVPILSIISYILLEERSKKTYLCILFTITYALTLLVLNIIDVVKGPYPFLMVKAQNPLMTLLWAIIIVGGSYIVGAGLNILNKKTQHKRS